MGKSLAHSRILFYIPEGNVETSGVYASQVLGLARYCVKIGAKCLIFQWAPCQRSGKEIRYRNLEEGIDVVEDFVPRKYRQFWFQTRDYRRLNKRFIKAFVEFSPTHIYCRQYQTCRAAKDIAVTERATLIYSMRGPDAFERRQMGGIKNFVASLYTAWAVRRAMKACDKFTTMSHSFAKWNKEKFGRDAIVFPCCVTDGFFKQTNEAEKRSVRLSLGFAEDDTVVVWCGGVFVWQRLDDVVCLLRDMSKSDPKLKALFIVREADEMRSLCAKHGYDKSKYHIISLNPTDVPKYLQACDVGIDCLLQDDFKCSICCPVKIGEYLASGLPVLATSNMGDVPKRLSESGAGAILAEPLNAKDALAKMNRLLGVDKEVMRNAAKKYYSWDGNKVPVATLFS